MYSDVKHKHDSGIVREIGNKKICICNLMNSDTILLNKTVW